MSSGHWIVRLAFVGAVSLPGPVLAQSSAATTSSSDAQIVQAADALWYRTSRLGLEDGGAAAIDGHNQVRRMLEPLVARGSQEPAAYWMIARSEYDLGEILARTPEEAKKNEVQRLKLYDDIIRLSTICVEKVAPTDGSCWYWVATGLGRRSTAKGVLNSLFTAKDVEKAWLKGLSLNPQYKTAGGEPQMNNIRYGLGVFYRMVPDSWLVKLVAGVRGDIRKAVAYFRDAVAAEPYRIELRKELAVALLCWADRDDAAATSATEGRAILEQILAGKFDGPDPRNTDATDKRHARELLNDPSIACGYSRDGVQDLDESKIKR